MDTANDILHGDPNRRMTVRLEKSTLTGAITGGALVSFDGESKWIADKDSDVVLNGDVPAGAIDALPGVTITARGGAAGEAVLPSGGTLIVSAE